ncbi:MAG TPA: UDP-3-O-acyl-N-acetylglucosamine deacetylase [bacterium]|nr:UDP-3-O-acyl-N-acetylglucosamine deacetylase [bacterium]
MSGATISSAAGFTGRDWMGRAKASVRLCPAGPGTGIWFNGHVRATTAGASVSDHMMSLGRGRHKVRMVEHLLAACSGLGITDLAVETSGDGLPIGDGSAGPYVRLLREAGIVRYKEGPRPALLGRPVLVKEGPRFIAAVPAHGLALSCLTRFPEFGPQFGALTVTPASFQRALARARTLARTEMSPAAVQKRYGLRFRLRRVGRFVCAERLRFTDEPCRHKALDLLGDLALLGRPLEAEVFAFMPGHDLNLTFVRTVEKELEDL